MDTVVFVDSTVIQHFSKQMVLVKINAEVDTLAAQKYGVMGYPTIIVADATGKEFDRIIGYLPPAEFLTTVSDYQHGNGTLPTLLTRAKTDNSPLLAKQIAEKYKYRADDKSAELWYQKVLTGVKPTDTLAAMIRTDIADMYRRKREYPRALALFTTIEKDFAGTPYAANAAIFIGIVQTKSGDSTGALATYQRYLKMYPNGDDTDYARSHIESLTKH